MDELLNGLKSSYGLAYVSVVLCDPDHDIRHLMLAAGSPAEDFDRLLMVDSMAGLTPQHATLRSPWLGAYSACDHQLIFPRAGKLASIAIIPLLHRDKLIGSINLGSDDAARFTRELATDVLTGWHNRRYLQVRLFEELARARRERSHVVCLMLDVDHFKRINDRWGHVAGDAVLRELANRIDAEVRASDVAARYGGEEFVLLLPDTNAAAAERLAERIRRAITSAPFALPDGDCIAVTVSIGIASVCPDPRDDDLKTAGDALLARADVAMYRAKSAGRDQVAIGDVA